MKRVRVVLWISVCLTAWLAPAGCDYGRMYDQDSVRTYEREVPAADPRTVPVNEGFQILSTADPLQLKNPLPSSREVLEQGRHAYTYFCLHCHGPGADGFGTVGQSFVPVPSDLRSSPVQTQADGELYAKIRLGFKRHPNLYTTVGNDDAWALIVYLRSLKRAGP